jgi:hypothetical protein
MTRICNSAKTLHPPLAWASACGIYYATSKVKLVEKQMAGEEATHSRAIEHG